MRRLIAIIPKGKINKAGEWFYQNTPDDFDGFVSFANPSGNPRAEYTHACINIVLEIGKFSSARQFLEGECAALVAEGEVDLRAPSLGKTTGQAFITKSGLTPMRKKQ